MTELKILFVCIGNTCRSPMAEIVMKNLICDKKLNWMVDSAGLRNWNIGRLPEDRCIKVLEEHGYTITPHIGRMITANDFNDFDYILSMDENNLRELKKMEQELSDSKKRSKIELLGSYLGRAEDEIIRDPYFSSGMSSFNCVFLQITESCKNFIEKHQKNYV